MVIKGSATNIGLSKTDPPWFSHESKRKVAVKVVELEVGVIVLSLKLLVAVTVATVVTSVPAGVRVIVRSAVVSHDSVVTVRVSVKPQDAPPLSV